WLDKSDGIIVTPNPEPVQGVQMEEGEWRILARKYYNPEYPASVDPTWGNIDSLPVNRQQAEFPGVYGLDMFFNDESTKLHKYEGSDRPQGAVDRASIVPALRCMLVIGDKVLAQKTYAGGSIGYEWEIFKKRTECSSDAEFYSQSFYIGFNPKVGDYLVGSEYKIAETARYADGIEAEGMVIPIRESDHLAGDVTFLILGPAFTLNNDGEIYAADLYKPSGRLTGDYIMDGVSAIWVRDFSIKIISDNARLDPLDSNDIVYISDETERFANPKDDIEMAVMSDLTTDERARLGVSDTLRENIAVNAFTKEGVTSVWDPLTQTQAKPEQLYVDYYYRETATPRVEREQSIKANEQNPIFNSWEHPALPGKTFYPLAVSRDLQDGSATLKLREI
ncbi:MAG: hypothetical protein K2N91_00480, partial [Muribaculaceae bacterium]|nr:hypothetical protein [Muribaculaceae bacterium]